MQVSTFYMICICIHWQWLITVGSSTLYVMVKPVVVFLFKGNHNADLYSLGIMMHEKKSHCVFSSFVRILILLDPCKGRSRSPKAILISAPITFLKWAKSQYFIRTLIPAFKLLMKRIAKILKYTIIWKCIPWKEKRWKRRCLTTSLPNWCWWTVVWCPRLW